MVLGVSQSTASGQFRRSTSFSSTFIKFYSFTSFNNAEQDRHKERYAERVLCANCALQNTLFTRLVLNFGQAVW